MNDYTKNSAINKRIGLITGFFNTDENWIAYVLENVKYYISIRKLTQPFFPFFAKEILIQNNGNISPPNNNFSEILHNNFVAKHSIINGSNHVWILYAVFNLNNKIIKLPVINITPSCNENLPPKLEKKINYPLNIKASFDKDHAIIVCKLKYNDDERLVETLIDWQSENRLHNLLEFRIRNNSDLNFITDLLINIITQIKIAKISDERKDLMYRTLISEIFKFSCKDKSHIFYNKSHHIVRELFKDIYFYSDDFLNYFLSFIELWVFEKQCNCISLLKDDLYNFWGIRPIREIECILFSVIKTSEISHLKKFKILIFTSPVSINKFLTEIENKIDIDCDKRYIYSKANFINDIRIRNLEKTYLQFDCGLFSSTKSCNANCIVERHKDDVIIDYSSKIPKDHRNFSKAFYVNRNIFSDWKEYIGSNGLYGIFSIRKSGKSTSLKMGLGGNTEMFNNSTLYINLTENKFNKEGVIFPLISDAEYKYDFEKYLMNYIIYNYKNLKSLKDFRYIVIDEYETLFRGLNDIYLRGGREYCEKVICFISSLSVYKPVIISGQNSSWYKKVMPENNPLNNLNQLKLDLFDMRDTIELIKAIARDNFIVDLKIIENIYSATAGHPRIIINFMSELIKYLAKERVKKKTNIDIDFLKNCISKDGIDNIFLLENVMDPLQNYYTKAKLEQESRDDFYASVLNTFNVYEDNETLKEEEIILRSNNVISKDDIKILISANFLQKKSKDINIKIPLLKDLFFDINNLEQYLLKN